MAALCKHVCGEVFAVSRNVWGTVFSNTLQVQAVRCLYSPAALGIDSYVRTRERVGVQFQNIGEKFRSKMKEYTDKSNTNMIFTEDLKNMVHLAESSPEDIELILQMMKRFNQQNKNIRFGSFIFGPVVMRMFHHLNQPQVAFEAFKDPEMEGFFDQIASYQILMDLLFENKEYTKALEVFEIIQNKQLEGFKYPKNVVVLVFSTLYKMNTPESFKQARELWAQLQNVGHVPTRRAVVFAAALAVNQNSPHDALEMLSGLRQQNYVTVRNLKVEALADLGRPEDAFPLLRSILEADVPNTKFTISKEAMGKLHEAVKKQNKEDLVQEFEALEKRLSNGEHILDDPKDVWLCREIQKVLQRPQNDEQRYLAASFNRQRTGSAPLRRNDVYRPRPGLAQMS